MQSPPAASTEAPISAALRDCAATIPPLETVAGLRSCWALLKRSFMVIAIFFLIWETSSRLRRTSCYAICDDANPAKRMPPKQDGLPLGNQRPGHIRPIALCSGLRTVRFLL